MFLCHWVLILVSVFEFVSKRENVRYKKKKSEFCVKWAKHVRERIVSSYSCISNEFAGPCCTKNLVEITATTRTLTWRLRHSMDGVAIGSSRSGRIEWMQYLTVTTTQNAKRFKLPLVRSMTTLLSSGMSWRHKGVSTVRGLSARGMSWRIG